MNRPLPVRLLRGLAKAVAALCLLLATTWTGAYFALGSSPGREALAGLVEAQAPGVEVAALRWGPAPDRLVFAGVSVGAPRPLAGLAVGSVDLALGSLWQRDTVIERLELSLTHVHASVGPDGKVDLLVLVAPPRPPKPTGPRTRPRPRLTIEALDVRVGEVWVRRGVDALHVRDLALRGALTLGEELDVALAVTTGPLDLALGRGRRVWGASSLTLDELTLTGELTLSSLNVRARGRIERDGVPLFRLAAAVSPGLPATLSLDAALSAEDVRALLPGAPLLAGLSVAGMELSVRPAAGDEGDRVGARVSGRIAQLYAPVVALGWGAMHHVALAIEHFELDAGRLIPQLEARLGPLQAARLEVLGWTLEGLDLAGGEVRLQRRLTVTLAPGHIAHWGLGPLSAGPVDALSLDADLGLTGGPIIARLTGAFGAIEARGKLRLSPLTGKAGFGAEVAFADLTGAPARALLPELAEDHALSTGTTPIRGIMTLEVDGGEVVFDEGVVHWSDDTPRTMRWDGYEWAEDTSEDAP